MSGAAREGAFVVSLDFELHWGMRDHVHREDLRFGELRSSRRVVTDLAELFKERGIRATWAAVGFLFASSRQELLTYLPEVRPHYRRRELDPYAEPLGDDEDDDPEHLAGSLVRLLADTPGQEVASHTFSHYYCLEPGQDEATLRADLAAAQAIAASHNLHLDSLVLPRNQWNPNYAQVILENGFTCIRGPQRSSWHTARPHHGALRRAARLIETYTATSAPPTTPWEDVHRRDGLCDVPASAFLRPSTPARRPIEPLQLATLRAGMRDAARRGRIFHLWWHPHNFARHPKQCFGLLHHLLDELDQLSSSEGMRSMSMGDVARIAESSTYTADENAIPTPRRH